MYNETDLMQQYDDFINSQHDSVEINGIEYPATEILKRNQVVYRDMFLSWCAEHGYDF